MPDRLVTNLCFHGIGTPERVLEPGEELYWVKAAQFEEFLEVASRYPSLRISFDDGNASDAALALPALRRHKLKAAFFVLSGRLDKPGSLTTAEVRSLSRAGMTVGSHGIWHRSWRFTTNQELHEELADAAAIIADAAGCPVHQVAFPFGAYDRRVLNAVRRHGFTRAYTINGGPAKSDAWLQSRYLVRSDDTPADIERRAHSPHGTPLAAAVRVSKSLVKRWR
jgi:peptidoglycan/xylan/chitin deacetylase (PgdA/CDA1 family)